MEFAQCYHDPPLTKKEWEILCEICDVPGFEEILFPSEKRILKKILFFISPHKMNPHEVNSKNLITKTPIKKQIKGRTDITIPFRIQKKNKEEKSIDPIRRRRESF